VNRTVSGYPDDYLSDPVVTTRYAEISSWSMSIGAGWGPIGLNMHYDHYSGMVGPTMLLSDTFTFDGVKGLGIGGSLSFGPNGVGYSGDASYVASSGLGVNASGGTNGFSITGFVTGRSQKRDVSATLSVSAGTQGITANSSVNQVHQEGVEAKRGAGFGLSSSGSLNLGGGDYSASAGFSSSSGGAGRGSASRSGFNVRIPLPGEIWVSFGFSEWTWTLDERIEERSHGYLHRDDVSQNSEKYERHVQGDVLYAAPDAYQVAAQGISGSFQPYWDRTNKLFDAFSTPNDPGEAKGLLGESTDPDETLHFRFTGDPGINFATMDKASGTPIDPLIDPEFRYGRTVTPHMDETSGKIRGFTITDTDGKVYEFDQAVYNMYKYTKTVQNNESDFTTTNEMKVPYATSWMLTAIKGPDYVDRDTEEGPSDGDWGYWVKLHYEESGVPSIWRSPFEGTSAGNDPDFDLDTFTIGARQHVTLRQIETATHIADFENHRAQDRRNARSDTGLKLDVEASGEADGPDHTFAFRGELRELLTHPYNRGDEVLIVRKWGVETTCDYNYGGGECDSPATRRVLRGTLSIQMEGGPSGSSGRLTTDDIEYDPASNRTMVDIRSDSMSGNWSFLEASVPVNDLVEYLPDPAVKLDRVALYAKADPNVQASPGGGYEAVTGAETVQSVDFGYDYALADEHPAASTGKLTLKSVATRGRNGAQILPPHEFEYANGDDAAYGNRHDALNPVYNKHDFDRWGSYRDPNGGNDRGPFKHMTPQEKTRADRAAAWSLTSILKPTGGRVDIEYESDDYYWAGDHHDAAHLESYSVTEGSTDREWILPEVPPELRVGDTAYLAIKKTTYSCPVCTSNLCYGTQETSAETIPSFISTGINSMNGETVRVSEPQNLPQSDVTVDPKYQDTCRNGTSYSMHLLASPDYVRGGGTRVSTVTSTDGVSIYETRYKYDEAGRSSGVASSLPDTRGNSPLSHRFPFIEFDDLPRFLGGLYMSHELSYGRPAPGVIYSSVEVTSVTEADEPLAGKTKYEFYTAKDHPYAVNADSSSGEYRIDITDRSAIYGRPKATTLYEYIGQDEGGNPVFRPKKRSEVLYAFSDEVSDRGIVYDSTGQDLGDVLMGAVSERQYFENNYTDEDDNKRTTQGRVTRRTHAVYRIGTAVEEYDYVDPQQVTPERTAHQLSRTLAWDARTGAAVATGETRSDGSVTVAKTEPAYWYYDGMREKNMLVQEAKSTSYRMEDLSLSETTDLNESDFTSGQTTVLGSKVTTWSNQFDQRPSGQGERVPIWLKNATYAWVPRLTGTADFPFSDESKGTYDQAIAPPPTSSFPWQRTSDVSKYDQYGRALENTAADGSRSSVLYGYDRDALVVATASKASYDEVAYFDFEGPRPDGCYSYAEHKDAREAHTGQNANRAEILDWQNRCDITLPAGEYELSFWAKVGTADASTYAGVALSRLDNGNVVIDTRQVLDPSGWHRYDSTFRLAEESTLKMYMMTGGGDSGHEPSKYHWIDQIRIQPVGARMRTFTYDPITWKVTSITDANGVSSYFDYDDAGRLIATRDQDGYVRSRQRYAVASMRFQSGDGFAPSRLKEGETFTVTADMSSMSPHREDWACQWSYGGEHRISETCSPETFTATSWGSKSVSLDVFDPSGRRAAHSTKVVDILPAEVDFEIRVSHNAFESETSPQLVRQVTIIPSGGTGEYDVNTHPYTSEEGPDGRVHFEVPCLLLGGGSTSITVTVTDAEFPTLTASKSETVASCGMFNLPH
jgi:YD repeat-containing protein